MRTPKAARLLDGEKAAQQGHAARRRSTEAVNFMI
jgi:hypothetical protein